MKENMVKTIGEHEYQFFMLPAMESVKLFTRIVKLISPALSLLSGDDKTSVLERKIDIEQVVKALQNSLDENEVEYVINKLFSQTICTGVGQLSDRAVVNEHFKGNLSHLFKVVWGALEAQYGDFLAGKPELEKLVQGNKKATKVG